MKILNVIEPENASYAMANLDKREGSSRVRIVMVKELTSSFGVSTIINPVAIVGRVRINSAQMQ